MAVKLAPIANDAPFVDANGNPLTGGLLYTYVAGSTTPQATYTDSGGLTQNANPIELNSNGYPASGGSVVGVWLTEGQSYKFVLKTSGGTTVWTRDGIRGVNDTSTTQDQWVASGLTPTYVSATSFTLAGDQTTTFHIGRRLKTTNSGGTVYSTIVSSVYGALTTIVVANDAGTLDSGLSAVSYGVISAASTSDPAIGAEYVCQGRLTLTSGTPITTSDVTAAETVYFAPFRGNKIDLYDATEQRWVRYKFSELSLDVPDAAQMNDVFIYNNGGTLTLEAVAWTNDTTRATALTTQDGVYVKSGATGRRYLGSFRSTTDGNGQTEDSRAKRYFWNYYNRVSRPMRVLEGTNSWTYTTAAYRQANNSAANQLDFVVGVSEDIVKAEARGAASNTAALVSIATGIGLDATNAIASGSMADFVALDGIGQVLTATASYNGFPGVGRHYLAWLEYSDASGTSTWYGDNGASVIQMGIHGELLG